jgi:hypothetical protein
MRITSAISLCGLMLLAGIAVPQSVAAQDFELRIGPDGVRPRYVDPDEPRYVDPDEEGYRYSRRPRGRCDLDEATDIARDEGLRRPRVVSVNSRRVVVRGRTPSGSETIVFANRRGCPVIG